MSIHSRLGHWCLLFPLHYRASKMLLKCQEGLLWPHYNCKPLPPSLCLIFFHYTFYHIVQLSNFQFLLPLLTLSKILEGRELLFNLFTTAILVFRIILKYFLNKSKSYLHMLLLLSHFSRVRLFATLWTVAHEAPLSMGFSRP